MRSLFRGCLIILAGIGVLTVYLLLTTVIGPDFLGSRDLGGGLYLTYGRNETKIIVLDKSSDGASGFNVIPSYANYTDANDNITEEVVKEKHNKRFVIVRTRSYPDITYKYYIVTKDYDPKMVDTGIIINRYTNEFTDSMTFIKACEARGITLRF